MTKHKQKSHFSSNEADKPQTASHEPVVKGDEPSKATANATETTECTDNSDSFKMAPDVKLPYGMLQQKMLARKTKTIDLKIENALKSKVLQLSQDIDSIDTVVFIYLNLVPL